MTQPQKERLTVTAIVEKKGQGKSGNEAHLTIGAFESKYPTLLNKIPDADFALLVPGRIVTIIVERGNPMKPKEGGAYDGSKPWMFWWNWVGMAAPRAAPAAKPKPVTSGAEATSAPPPPAARGWTEAYSQSKEHSEIQRASIERQKALDLAVQFRLGIATLTKEPTDAEHVIATARQFFTGWLAEQDTPESPAKPAAPKPAPTAVAESPLQAMNKRAVALAGKYGLTADELKQWCNEAENRAFPSGGMTWANAGIMEKNAALDVFEKSYAPQEPQ